MQMPHDSATTSTPEGESTEALKRQVADLQDQLTRERRRSSGYVAELRHVKEQSLAVQKQVEQEEEFITNKLMKRLEQLKNEKQTLANEVEQEEEYLINNLQKRLTKVHTEKVDLEKQLETEQEYIVNKLQKKLAELRAEQNKLNREKVDLENQLEAEQEYIVNKLQKQLTRLANEKQLLQMEKSDLQRQVSDLAASSEKLHTDRVVMMKNQMEMEPVQEENIVNRLQRQIEGLLANYKALESGLEARGIAVKEIVTPSIEKTTEWVYGRSPTKSDGRLSGGFGTRRSRTFSQGSSSVGLSPESSFSRPSGNQLQIRSSMNLDKPSPTNGLSSQAIGMAS